VTGWQQLTGINANDVDILSNGDVAVSFFSFGVYRFVSGAGWQQLTSSVAVNLGIA